MPFFSISGSDFVEMFVGVGASRVRDLFEQAKAAAPAIIFVDEIDAVGRHRGAGLGGGHDEREQTLNQLLVEMDGFDARTGVILIAATNRPDILDPALLRPGRFDRQIVVDRPDLEGRKAILEVHAKGKPLEPNVHLDVLARRTPGFTGADLANLMNEAALLAARRNLHADRPRRARGGHRPRDGRPGAQEPGDERAGEAHDRLPRGRPRPRRPRARRTPTRSTRCRSSPAAGPSAGPSRCPLEDKYLHTRSELEDSMAMLLGGRTAEELVFGEITTGASDDIERATDIARGMVTQYGMSDRLGPQQLGKVKGEVFLGRDMGHEADYSDEVAGIVDAEVRALIDNAHDRARAILDDPPRHPRRARRHAGREGDPRRRRPGRDLRPARQGHRRRRARSRAHRRARRRSSPSWSARASGAVVAERRPRAGAGARPRPRAGRRRPGGGGGGSASEPRAPAAPDPHPPPWPLRGRARPSTPRWTSTASRRRCARSSRPSARTPTATACWTRPTGSPACTPRSAPGSTRTRPSTSRSRSRPSHDEMVMVRDIPLYSLCEHHLVPFIGQGPRGLHPRRDGRITGLSKFARLVDGFGRRPQVQERLTVQIADAIEATLEPSGRDGGDRGRAPLHVDARRQEVRDRPRSPRRCGACSARTSPPATRPCGSSSSAATSTDRG